MSILAIRDLQYSYDKKKKVLKGISGQQQRVAIARALASGVPFTDTYG